MSGYVNLYIKPHKILYIFLEGTPLYKTAFLWYNI